MSILLLKITQLNQMGYDVMSTWDDDLNIFVIAMRYGRCESHVELTLDKIRDDIIIDAMNEMVQFIADQEIERCKKRLKKRNVQ